MKHILFSLFILFVITSCSKEEEIIEKNLWNKRGEWAITKFEASYVSTEFPENDFTKTILDGGTIEFKEDGTGKMTHSSKLAEFLEDISYGGVVNQGFTFYNSEKSIFIIYGNSEGLGFDLEWEKDKMNFGRSTLDEYITSDGNGNPIIESTTLFIEFSCEKKK